MMQIKEFDPVAVASVPESERSIRLFVISLISALIFLVLILSMLKIDVVARFDGKIAAQGGTVKMLSLEHGAVSKVHVSDGEVVKKGDPILSLDNTDLSAQLQVLMIERKELLEKLSDMKLLERVVGEVPDQLSESQTLSLIQHISRVIDQDLASRKLGKRGLNEFRDHLSSMWETLRRLNSECREREKDVERLKDLETMRRTRYSVLREAAAQAIVSKLQLLEAEETLTDIRRQAIIAEARLETASNAKKEQLAKLMLFISESRKVWRDNTADYAARISTVESRINSTKHAVDQLEIRSPLDGIVQDIDFQHAGMRIPQGAAIASVVPVDDPIVVEGQLNNIDVAYVKRGLPARIKVESYPYMQYGALRGSVSFVARDSVSIAQGQRYKIYINVDKTQSGRISGMPLLPGMSVNAEVITGQRRLMEYFYNSTVDAVDGAFGER